MGVPRALQTMSLGFFLASCSGDEPDSVRQRSLTDNHPEAGEIRATMQRLLRASADGQLQGEEAQSLISGEAASRWTEDSLGPLPLTVDVVRKVTDSRAVVRVCVDSEDRDYDLYFYARRSGDRWLVEAMRGFAQTGFIEYFLQELENASPDELESMREAACAEGRPFDLEYQRANARLVLSDDGALRDWFDAHRSDLDALVVLAVRDLTPGKVDHVSWNQRRNHVRATASGAQRGKAHRER